VQGADFTAKCNILSSVLDAIACEQLHCAAWIVWSEGSCLTCVIMLCPFIMIRVIRVARLITRIMCAACSNVAPLLLRSLFHGKCCLECNVPVAFAAHVGPLFEVTFTRVNIHYGQGQAQSRHTAFVL
jgi:hypothetical protein